MAPARDIMIELVQASDRNNAIAEIDAGVCRELRMRQCSLLTWRSAR